MKTLLNRMWQDVTRGDNLDAYALTITALAISCLGALGQFSDAKIGPAILGVLALCAIGLLAVRQRVDSISRVLGKGADHFLLEEFPQDVAERIGSAQEIWICGVTLSRLLKDWQQTLSRRLSDGHCKLRVVIRAPDGGTLALVARNSYENVSPEHVRNSINLSINRLQELRRIAPDKVEIRTLDHPIAVGIRAFDVDSQYGTICVEHHPFKGKWGSIPKMVISRSDGKWYDVYRQQFLAYWDAASPLADSVREHATVTPPQDLTLTISGTSETAVGETR